MNAAPLLPISQRVTHFDGGPDTHGKGTIVGYNGRQPDTYAQTNLKDAATIAASADESAKPMLLGAIVNSFYDGVRCPYVVQWDPRKDGPEWLAKYPNGYKDVYERDSIKPIPA